MITRENKPKAPHRWWAPDIDDGERHKLVFEYVRALEDAQWDVRERMFRNIYMYTGEQIAGIKVEWRQRPTRQLEKARVNAVENLIETACARSSSRSPKISVVTKGAQWNLRQNAKNLERWLIGQRHLQKMKGTMQAVFRDGCAAGTGIGKTYNWHDRITTDRVFPAEVIVDETASLTSPPRQMHQRRFIDVDECVAAWGDIDETAEDDIWHAASTSEEPWCSYISVNPLHVPVIESWKLPSSPDAGDGMHMVSIENRVLMQEPWEHDWFPFFVFRWADPMLGWYGRGLPETVAWVQARLNRHATFEAACQDRALFPRVIVDGPDAQLQESITNDIGVIIPSVGRFQPIFTNPPAVPPEIYQDEDRKMALMHRLTGISEFSTGAQNRPPTGLDSRPAMALWLDYSAGRFAVIEQRYDDLHVDWATLSIECARELVAEGKETKAVWHRPQYGLDEVDFSEIDLTVDAFRLRLLPASSTPDTPAGMRQRLEEERAAGRLADDLYRYFLATLDIEAPTNLLDAGMSDIMRTIERLGSPKEPWPAPREYQALELGLFLVQMEENRLHALGAPDTVLRRFGRWIEQAEFLKDQGKGVQVGGAPQLGGAQAGGGPQAPQPADMGRIPMPGLTG
jgi:hypothetical protein